MPSSELEDFIARWSPSGGGERSNYQLFLSELCDLIGVPKPDPGVPDDTKNAYVFDRSIPRQEADGSTTTNFIDLYKRGCFICETKQGVEGNARVSRAVAGVPPATAIEMSDAPNGESTPEREPVGATPTGAAGTAALPNRAASMRQRKGHGSSSGRTRNALPRFSKPSSPSARRERRRRGVFKHEPVPIVPWGARASRVPGEASRRTLGKIGRHLRLVRSSSAEVLAGTARTARETPALPGRSHHVYPAHAHQQPFRKTAFRDRTGGHRRGTGEGKVSVDHG